MKKNTRIITIVILAVAAVTALIYWQSNKHAIVEKTIDKAVDKKSGSLYSLKYDSSFIDELNGNASFYRVSLISDTTVAGSEDIKNIYKINIAEVAIKGANVVGLLTGSSLQAKSIQFIDPVFEILKRNAEIKYTREDTLALYEHILGKYKSIKAQEIVISNGSLNFSSVPDKSLTAVRNINVNLTDFKIDSTKDYDNLISYFINGLEVKVGGLDHTIASKKNFSLNGISFSASKRRVDVKDFQSYTNDKMVSNFTNLSLDGLENAVFIREQRISANELRSDGGTLTVYTKKGGKENSLHTDSSVFDRASIRKVVLGKTKVIVLSRDKPAEPPLILNNIQLTAVDIPLIEGSLTSLIAKSNWVIQGDGLQRESENKLFNIGIGPFVLDKGKRSASIGNISFMPKMSEAQFVKTRKVQEDYIQFESRNIAIRDINLEEAFSKQSIHAAEVSLQPTIKIFNDRTLPRNTKSKMASDPALLIRNLPFPVQINKLEIRNGNLSYRERGMISGKQGTLLFQNLNATITNISNIPEVYNAQPLMRLKASTLFMGKSPFTTSWIIPLNKSNGPFSLSGKIGSIEGKQLNTVLEPLAMISLKEGTINDFSFESNGDQGNVQTKATFLYSGLNLNLLKKENDKAALQRKGAMSFLANIFISDRNPNDGKVRQNVVDFKRDSSRSFFYLVSQSFFLGIKKTITGKDNVK